MEIYEVTEDRWDLRALLLLADPSERLVAAYLNQGFLLAARIDGQVIGEILTIPVEDGWEIKNLAVDPAHQRRGIGRQLVEAAAIRLPGETMLFVGTAEEPVAGRRFYERCGFVFSHRIEDFFLEHYDEPPIDEGVRCVHLAVYRRRADARNFFQSVYSAVQRIPLGRVSTYGQIALLCGNPRASRAVGYALHQNPMPGIIPCHRVVNRQGRLAPGFAFGGPDEQRELLLREGVAVDADGFVDMKRYAWFG